MKKTILVIIDGLADRPIRQLGNKTPLEAANCPALDRLAAAGSSGMLDTLGGKAPESDEAIMGILGYNPYKFYTGRGPVEAVGLGMGIKNGMVSVRCNFATVTKFPRLSDRRVGRTLTTSESKALADSINRKVKLKDALFLFKSGIAHRAVLLIRARKKLSAKVSNTDPAYEITGNGIPVAKSRFEMKVKEARPFSGDAKVTAKLINEFTRQSNKVLESHPVNKRRKAKGLLAANVIISRDAGSRLPKLFNISKRYRRKFAILADMPLEVGLGKLAGMDVVKMPRHGSGKGSGHRARLSLVLSALKKHDAVYVHIKNPDDFAHEGDYNGKKKCIEEIDREFFQPLLKKVSMKNTVIAVTPDHATPCNLKGHSGDPVPFIISGGNVKSDRAKSYSEKSCRKGRFGKMKATKFMPLLMRLSSSATKK